MELDTMPPFVLAAAVVVGALALAGVPLEALALPLAFLTGPLMLIFLMRGKDHDGGQRVQETVR